MPLELRKVSRTAPGAVALRNISLRLEDCSFNTLLGPTGAGKTELLRVLAGLDPLDTGEFLLHGRDVAGLDVRRRNVAFVYQNFVNYPGFTVFENIAAPLRVRGVAADEVDARVRSVAALLGLEPLLRSRPGQISGGQQQRLAIARALVREAELILLDEPLANLDYKLRERLREEIREIFRERGSIVVFATADPGEALLFGGNLIVLERGRVVAEGPAGEVYRRPPGAAAAKLLSDPPMNLLVAGCADGSVRVAGTDLSCPAPADLPEGPALLGLRPHAIRLASRPGDRALSARVELAELSGSETFLHVRVGPASLIARLKGTNSFNIEETVACFVNERDFFLFSAGGELVRAPGDEGREGRM